MTSLAVNIPIPVSLRHKHIYQPYLNTPSTEDVFSAVQVKSHNVWSFPVFVWCCCRREKLQIRLS